MRYSTLSLLIITIGLSFGFQVQAGKKKSKSDTSVKYEKAYTKKQYKALIRRVKKLGKRKTAGTKPPVEEDVATSERFRNIRNSFIGGPIMKDGKPLKVEGKPVVEPGAKTAADIRELIVGLDDNFRKGHYKGDLKSQALAVNLLMMKPFEGFIYRARYIFEGEKFLGIKKIKEARMAHALAVTGLRAIAAGINVYLPTPQWEAAFKFTTLPAHHSYISGTSSRCMDGKWSKKCSIKTDENIQTWLRHEVLPQLEVMEKFYLNSIAKMNIHNPIYMDNKIFYQSARFVSSRDRFLKIGPAERLTILAGIQAAISNIYGMSAFHFDGFFEVLDSLGKVYGWQSLRRFDAGSATAKDRFAIFKKRKYRNLFKYRDNDDAKEWLVKSYDSLKASLQNSYAAWKYLDSREHDGDAQQNLFDPRVVAPFQRIMQTGFPNIFNIVGMSPVTGNEIEHGDVISAVVAGEKVTINLKKFFTHPPKSLKLFMPDGFVGEKDDQKAFLAGNDLEGFSVKDARNFRFGNPKSWRTDIYKKYFPDVETDEDVKRLSRVLSQSWGGFFLGLPLALVML